MTTILVTGRQGQLGWELRRALQPLGRVVAPGAAGFDLRDAGQVRRVMRELRPGLVVNPGAYTAVDQAEQERDAAFAINAAGAAVLAEEAARCGALMIHYSTDYVFDGTKGEPYNEDDVPAPQNVYGSSKLAGEQAVRAAGGDHLILRTSWVYAARGKNFLRTMLNLARERDELRVVADQVGAPTWARLLAETTAVVAHASVGERRRGGFESAVFHLTAAGETTWHGFAQALIEEARTLLPPDTLRCRRIEPIATADYPTPARRPLNSRLDTTRICRRFALELPPWQEGMKLCLEELYGHDALH